MEKCLIVGGGKISDNEWLRSVSKQYDFIIANVENASHGFGLLI